MAQMAGTIVNLPVIRLLLVGTKDPWKMVLESRIEFELKEQQEKEEMCIVLGLKGIFCFSALSVWGFFFFPLISP